MLKKDPLIFANGQQADADFYIRNGLVPVSGEQAMAWERMRIDVTEKVAVQSGAITISSFVTPGMSTYASAGGATSLQAFLASRAGAAVIGGVANATSQAIQSGDVKPFPVGISMITGGLGAGKGFVANVGWNAAGGGVNAWLNNMFYGANESSAGSAAQAGGAAALGYILGYGLSNATAARINSDMNAQISRPGWTSVGPGITHSTGPYALPYVLSNLGGSAGQEVGGSTIDKVNEWINNQNTLEGRK